MIHHATPADLPQIVAIYNAAIPGRMATADLLPTTVEARLPWFTEFTKTLRPLWVDCLEDGSVRGWMSLKSYYGRPAYQHTVELAVYVHPDFQGQGVARALITHALNQAPACQIKTMLAFIFGHNLPSLALFQTFGFTQYGLLPGVCELDGVSRDVVILGRKVA